jgi:tetratricopeptide (TPR) repeat protein
MSPGTGHGSGGAPSDPDATRTVEEEKTRTVAGGRSADAAAADSTRARGPGRGARLGHFRLEQPLGEGGSGTVFVAEDLDIPGRRVALKLIRAGGLTPDVEALRREASALAALQHPHILVVHEIGVSEWGPFLVTELMGAGSLSDRLAQGPLGEIEALRQGRAIADALRAAHAHGLLHRDIKPANLLLAADRATAKVADFGLVRDSRGDGPYDPLGAAGTPPYIAPEILEGSPPGPAADQFAFGVTLHQMLAGARPFDGPGWRAQVLDGTPAIARGLARDVEAIVRRAVARTPGERFPDMAAVVAALDRALLRRDPRRRLAQAAIAAAVLLVLAGAGLWAGLRFRQGAHAHGLNEEGRAALERGDHDGARRAFLAAHSADPAFLPACANLGALAGSESNPAWAVTILEECARTFATSPAVHYDFGTALRNTGRRDAAEHELRKALDLAGDGALRPLALNELAMLLVEAHRGSEAVALLEGAPHPAAAVEAAILSKTLGLAYLDAGRNADAATALRRGLDGPLPPPQRAAANAALGKALEAQGDAKAAVEAYSQALLSGPDAATEAAAHEGLLRLQGDPR